MKYDDAEYSFLNFETDRLPNEAGGTHTGMYLAWAASKDLLAAHFDEAALAPLKARTITGCDLFFDRCDGKLTDEDFNELGNAFTAGYYTAQFVADYTRVFADQMPNGRKTADDFCSVPDTWDNYARLAPVLDQRFAQWRQARATGPALVLQATAEDPAQAVEAIRARAKGGDTEAWFELGAEYFTGERVPRDMVAAADAFTRGAERGSAQCQFNLGVCFHRGNGRPEDHAKALHWYGQAANGGHAAATYQLAAAYRHGLGLPQDLVAADALMLLAQSRGSEHARDEGLTAGSLAEATVLLEQIRQPGQLLLILSRRRTGAVATLGARPLGLPHGAARTTGTGPAVTVGVGTAPERRVGSAAVVALLVGAVGFILLLLATSFAEGLALRALAVGLGAVAAFGAYRCSGGLGKSPGVSAVLAVLAFVPVLGSFVCLALVLEVYRQHRAR